ncbi:hypothetical protein [Rhizobium sp. BK176]|uniref:hypothetical protein n=1 Tax=Rhizobium sp. BK176 TaxID=2587071 RepID=UPI002167015D|nr:hypothetical protein [Rhizobium sp. BK176]MCS4088722.1 hypothetical protein [Rhizobium sp. BK176]
MDIDPTKSKMISMSVRTSTPTHRHVGAFLQSIIASVKRRREQRAAEFLPFDVRKDIGWRS